eukprot:m.113928 g.113928  ORF g.113928 m.113928 type:complete len:428 (+) comp9270_c0_seq17:222-1505(+)
MMITVYWERDRNAIGDNWKKSWRRFFFVLILLIALPCTNTTVTVDNMDNNYNYNETMAINNCPLQNRCRVVFLHIPKTGGTTLIHGIGSWVESQNERDDVGRSEQQQQHHQTFLRCIHEINAEHCHHIYSSSRADVPPLKDPTLIQSATIFVNHCGIAAAEKQGFLTSSSSSSPQSTMTTHFVSVVREPIARIVSLYNFYQPPSPFWQWYVAFFRKKIGCNVETRYFDSQVTQWHHKHPFPCPAENTSIARHFQELLQRAIETIFEKITLLGFHENHTAFFKALASTFLPFGERNDTFLSPLLSQHAIPHAHHHGTKVVHPSVSLETLPQGQMLVVLEDNMVDAVLYLYLKGVTLMAGKSKDKEVLLPRGYEMGRVSIHTILNTINNTFCKKKFALENDSMVAELYAQLLKQAFSLFNHNGCGHSAT